MKTIEYIKLEEVNSDDFIPLLNNQKNRVHLLEHEFFDADTVKLWIESKLKMNSTFGCKVRAIMVENQLAGWCGIQLEDGQYEIAIVIDDKFWGIGKRVFKEIMLWAKSLGHSELLIHFLHTRPRYKFLQGMSKKVYESELYGKKFTTYELEVVAL